jgi:hypothetical protein
MSLESGDLQMIWNRWFPDTPPVGFLLRQACPERWLRIHSLPESKRYPDSGFDSAEIQRRHAAVAEALLGSDDCLFFVSHECTGRYSRNAGALAGFTPEQLPRLWAIDAAFHDEDHGTFAVPICVSGCRAVWDRERFARFIAAVAEDQMRGILLNSRTGAVYAPYDGGADLIGASALARDLLREQFATWLPENPDGL